MEAKFIINPITKSVQYYITENLDYYLTNPNERTFVYNNGLIVWDSNYRNLANCISYVKIVHRELFDNNTIIIGVLNGACYINRYKTWYNEGIRYKNKEEWFAALTSEQRAVAIWEW